MPSKISPLPHELAFCPDIFIRYSAVLHQKVLYLLNVHVCFGNDGTVLNPSMSTNMKEQGMESGKGLLGYVGGLGAPSLTGNTTLRLGHGSSVVLPNASLTF